MANTTHPELPNGQKAYRLITGKDDDVFCMRVSQALKDGYQLYGNPRSVYDFWRGEVKLAQAVVWPGYGPQ